MHVHVHASVVTARASVAHTLHICESTAGALDMPCMSCMYHACGHALHIQKHGRKDACLRANDALSNTIAMHLARASASQAAFFDEAGVRGSLVGMMRDQWIPQVPYRYHTVHRMQGAPPLTSMLSISMDSSSTPRSTIRSASLQSAVSSQQQAQ